MNFLSDLDSLYPFPFLGTTFFFLHSLFNTVNAAPKFEKSNSKKEVAPAKASAAATRNKKNGLKRKVSFPLLYFSVYSGVESRESENVLSCHIFFFILLSRVMLFEFFQRHLYVDGLVVQLNYQQHVTRRK